MGALDSIVKQGKALYIGISSYAAADTKKAADILKQLGTPCLIHQPRYSMLDRWVEDGLLNVLEEYGVGSIAFSPLAQGMLTDKYLNGIPENSRAASPNGYLQTSDITPEKVAQLKQLNEIAKQRNQSLAQMALAWLLKDDRITSVLIGASSVAQLENNLASLDNTHFTSEELKAIELILS
ncbi:MAG: aldo/keto reductase, partial [Sphingobacteriales bacterium]|nr:aldo/keto reductase [Sphingobacteriales bacterium]